MTVENGAGRPEQPGLYATEIYSGWKLLEWKDGEWWHQGAIGRWTASQPVQWVGPLPMLMKARELIEYDL